MTWRYGISVPLAGMGLLEQRPLIEELEGLGYRDVWSSEVDGTDAFTPLALISQWAPSLRLGTAIVPVFTRGPATIAQSAASLALAAPGRVVLGIGSSSDTIVQAWNGRPFEQPYQRVRDTLAFLRPALAGEKVTHDYETFSVAGFRLSAVPPETVPIHVAALRPGMLRLAARHADGVILNWLSPGDLAMVLPELKGAADHFETVARPFVVLDDDAERARAVARRMITQYLNVPVYAAYHEWLGRGPALAAMWAAWRRGDRKAALAAIPDAVVDDLVVWGSPERCRAQLERYAEAGVTTTIPVVTTRGDPAEAVRALAPR